MTTKTPEASVIDTHVLSSWIGISTKTLEVWRRKGLGPKWMKLGAGTTAAVRYRTADVLAWLDAQTHGGQS